MITLQDIAILGGFLICAYVVGRILGVFDVRRLQSINTRTWSPLLSCLDNPTANGGWLTGHYRGHEVRAQRGEKKPSSSSRTGYNFEIELGCAGGAQDWQVDYELQFVVFGERRGVVKSDDNALTQRLVRAGVVDMIDQIDSSKITHVWYNKKRNRLIYNEDVRLNLVPSPARLTKQLDLLARLAAVNERANADKGEY